MIGPIHSIDLFWACLATCGACYPLYRLRGVLNERPGRNLAAMMAIFLAYPWASAVLHLTPFDKGLIYALLLFCVPLYFVMMIRFVGYADHRLRKTQHTAFVIASALSLFAVTNPWH